MGVVGPRCNCWCCCCCLPQFTQVPRPSWTQFYPDEVPSYEASSQLDPVQVPRCPGAEPRLNRSLLMVSMLGVQVIPGAGAQVPRPRCCSQTQVIHEPSSTQFCPVLFIVYPVLRSRSFVRFVHVRYEVPRFWCRCVHGSFIVRRPRPR